MPSYFPPKRAVEYIVYVSLVSQANTKIFQVNPTLAAGDAKVSIDGGADANLATLPVVTPAASKHVKVTLSSAEMTGDNIKVTLSDAAGAEWCDMSLTLHPTVRQVDDLAFPTVTGRSLGVSAGGQAGVDWANIGSPTTAQNLSATNIDVDQVVASVSGAVGSVTAGVTLAASAVQAIWDALTSALTTVGSIGKRLADFITGDAFVRLGAAGASLTAVPWNAAWDAEVQSEVQDAIEANNLDHLVGTATAIPAIIAGTYLDQMMDDGTAVFDRTTDSLQAIRDTAPLGTAMRGTDSAALASVCTEVRLAELDAANLPTDIAARATPAQVNAEVVDALNVDTYAEPGQGVPAATTTIVGKLGHLYKAWRNRTTQTATQYNLYADNGTTIDQKATVSDDATTFDRNEIVSGP